MEWRSRCSVTLNQPFLQSDSGSSYADIPPGAAPAAAPVLSHLPGLAPDAFLPWQAVFFPGLFFSPFLQFLPSSVSSILSNCVLKSLSCYHCGKTRRQKRCGRKKLLLGLGSDLGARALRVPVLPHTRAAARMPEAVPSPLTPVFARCEHAAQLKAGDGRAARSREELGALQPRGACAAALFPSPCPTDF